MVRLKRVARSLDYSSEVFVMAGSPLDVVTVSISPKLVGFSVQGLQFFTLPARRKTAEVGVGGKDLGFRVYGLRCSEVAGSMQAAALFDRWQMEALKLLCPAHLLRQSSWILSPKPKAQGFRV